MSLLATSSDRALAGLGAVLRRLPPAWLPVVLMAVSGGAEAKVFLSIDEALALAFPRSTVEHRTIYLNAGELKRAQALAGVDIPGGIIHAYVARRDSSLVGTAYFDTHKVRTLPETIMVVVGPDWRVVRVEVIAFGEPASYLARESWYEQFGGRGLDAELALKRGIRGITGATLTARAATAAVRRTLALHQVIAERAP